MKSELTSADLEAQFLRFQAIGSVDVLHFTTPGAVGSPSNYALLTAMSSFFSSATVRSIMLRAKSSIGNPSTR
jgi:hypothetical protein